MAALKFCLLKQIPMQEKLIRNLITGQEITFTPVLPGVRGDTLTMGMAFNGIGDPPPMHFHPHQDEQFTVLSGWLVVQYATHITEYRSGDIIVIPRNTLHGMWNGYEGRTELYWEVFPAMRTAEFFQEVFGRTNERYLKNSKGLNFVQMIELANKYAAEFRLKHPPFWLVRLLYGILYPVLMTMKAVKRLQYRPYMYPKNTPEG